MGPKIVLTPLSAFKVSVVLRVLGKGKALGHQSFAVLAHLLVAVCDFCQLYTRKSLRLNSEFRSV